MSGLLLLGGLVSGIAILVPVVLVLGLVIVLALRGEPDDGGRGLTVYLVLACFVGFLTLLFAATAAAASITDLVAGDDADSIGVTFPSSSSSGFSSGSSSEGFGEPPITVGGDASFGSSGQSHDDRAWTSLIQSMIAALAALVVLRFHWPRLEAVGGRAAPGGASARVRQAYCATLCFLVVVTLLVSASVATFTVVQAIAPGTTGAANRGDPVETFVPVAVLALGAALLFRAHWSRLEMPAFLRPLPPSDEGRAAA